MIHICNIGNVYICIFAKTPLIIYLKINNMKTKFLMYLLATGMLFPACADKVTNEIIQLPDENPDENPGEDDEDNNEEADSTFTINYIISPKKGHKPISKLIYGIGYYNNEKVALTKECSSTFIRFGGNNTTPYNWEINCSNAGHDWYHNSYTYGDFGFTKAGIWDHVIEGCFKTGKVPFITIPMLDAVAADNKGSVVGDRDQHRWKRVIPRKSTVSDVPLSENPDTSDDYVFTDESIYYLTQKHGKGKIKYSLDNEPDLWTWTHSKAMRAFREIADSNFYYKQIRCEEFVNRTIETAKAIKDVDEQAELFGFVSYGINGYLSFQGAPDWDGKYGCIKLKDQYDWFIDYFLEKTGEASQSYGKTLVDVLDFHAYPSERGDNPINKRDVISTPKDMKVRLQAPRRFWDPEYAKVYDPEVNQWDKWVIDYCSKFLPILPPMFNSLEKYNNMYGTNTKLAITEFQIGGYDDISGTIALTDVLGIYGKYGVYAANHWGTPGPNGFLAYDMFRDYDGKGSTFGDTYVDAELYNPAFDKFETSVYASIHGEDTKQLHIIVLNKNMEKSLKGEFKLEDAGVNYTTAEVYYVEGLSEVDKAIGLMEEIKKDDVKIEIKDNKFTYTMPKLSVAHIILK